MDQKPQQTSEQKDTPYAQYAILIFLYNVLFAGFLLLYKRSRQPLDRITALDFGLLGLATLRVSKTLSEDEITAVIREPLVEAQEEAARPKGHGGLRYALGKLLLCPTCTGTWVATFLTYSLHLFPRYTRPFLVVMAASGMEQFSDALLSLVYTGRNRTREEEELLAHKNQELQQDT